MSSLMQPAGGVGDSRRVVTTAGTRVQLATSGIAGLRSIAITALSTNTGIIAVGGSTVVAAAGTRTGVALAAGATVSLDIADITDVWLDSTVNGEGVSYAYLTI